MHSPRLKQAWTPAAVRELVPARAPALVLVLLRALLRPPRLAAAQPVSVPGQALASAQAQRQAPVKVSRRRFHPSHPGGPSQTA